MNVRELLVKECLKLKEGHCTCEEYSQKFIESLTPILPVKSMKNADGSVMIGDNCYLTASLQTKLKALTGRSLTSCLAEATWTESACNCVLIMSLGDLHVLFFRTNKTKSFLSKYIGSLAECVSVYYNYQYSEVNTFMYALLNIIKPPNAKGIGENTLGALEEYILGLCDVIRRNGLSNKYCRYQQKDELQILDINSKLLINNTPVMLRVSLKNWNSLEALDISENVFAPYIEVLPQSLNPLTGVRLTITEEATRHFLKTRKLPFEITRKTLETSLKSVLRHTQHLAPYGGAGVKYHLFKGKPAVSLQIYSSDKYLVCEIQADALSPKTVWSSYKVGLAENVIASLYREG